jgi:TRAP-type mannitol/chloroaromatic compound transport system permease small subunit
VRLVKKVLAKFDQLSIWSAKVVSGAVLVMVLAIAYDVILRYLFSAPTVWQYDISYMLGGSIIILGAGYVHLKHRHVRVDIIYNRFSPRTRLTLEVLFTLVFFFPFLTGLIVVAAEHALHAYEVKEFSEVGFWRPLMWPFRSVIPVGLSILLLQGLANFVRDLHVLVKGKEL